MTDFAKGRKELIEQIKKHMETQLKDAPIKLPDAFPPISGSFRRGELADIVTCMPTSGVFQTLSRHKGLFHDGLLHVSLEMDHKLYVGHFGAKAHFDIETDGFEAMVTNLINKEPKKK